MTAAAAAGWRSARMPAGIGRPGRAVRASTRARIGEGRRAGRLYAWLLASGLLVYGADFAAKVAAGAASGEGLRGADLAEWTTAAMLGAIAVLPAAAIAFALLATALLRGVFRGRGSLGDGVIAGAWAARLGGMILAAASLAEAAGWLLLPEAGRSAAVAAIGGLSLLACLWVWSAAMSEAQGFSLTWPLFVGVVTPVLASAVGLWMLP